MQMRSRKIVAAILIVSAVLIALTSPSLAEASSKAYGNSEPIYGNVAPTNRDTEPTDGNVDPTNRDTEPTDGNVDPTNRDTELTDGNTDPTARDVEPLPVKVLLLPKFEVGEMAGDFPGEAQFYYEQYLMDADEYDISFGRCEHNTSSGAGGVDTSSGTSVVDSSSATGEDDISPDFGGKLYYKDGVALYVLNMGKVNAALGTMAVLSDSRFDFSDAYIISTGCAGSAIETTVMGDVFIITSAVDYDLGHHADGREIADPDGTTWFHDTDFDSAAVVSLDPDLMEKVFALVKDAPVETTEVTRNYMRAAFDGADWAVRDPKVLRGTTVTGDNYWKGEHGHANALLMTETYHCPDPYVSTEMEDVAVARAVERMGLLDHLIIIRDSVNMDVFMLGSTPDTLWGNAEGTTLASEENIEAADIFSAAMKNNFNVGRIIIDRILENTF